jgi:hypothetical protein
MINWQFGPRGEMLQRGGTQMANSSRQSRGCFACRAYADSAEIQRRFAGSATQRVPANDAGFATKKPSGSGYLRFVPSRDNGTGLEHFVPGWCL